tara:strand:+ start:93 stop:467 length:375 start_codon:yes stop_codon:yes gene_type:complete
VARSEWIAANQAEFKAMDKITARISKLSIDLDRRSELGTLNINLKSCQTRPPTLSPDSAAYVEIFDKINNGYEKSKMIFSGWMFSSSPALNALEHPVYDISLISCKNSITTSQLENSSELISGN